jgi:D-glycero-alpha-D-manno-heptose-7-phosphate kinase
VISAQAPLRISLGGGGTDLPAYASRFGGFVLSAAIDKSVVVRLSSRGERPQADGAAVVSDSPLTRACLEEFGLPLDTAVTSLSEVPPNTGLGSSGSFTVALLTAICSQRGLALSPGELAKRAFLIESARLGEPVGCQDPTIAAFGGLQCIEIDTSGEFSVTPAPIAEATVRQLEQRITVFYTGIRRPSREVLSVQSARVAALEEQALLGMHRIKALGQEVCRLLSRGKLDEFGELLHQHWSEKQKVTTASSATLDDLYDAGMRAGALGGKVMGAGGGGFIMFCARPEALARVEQALRSRGLSQLPFRFGAPGAQLL